MRDRRAALVAAAGGAAVAEVEPGVWLVSDPTATERLLASPHALTARDDLRTSVTSWGADGLAAWMAARRAMRPALTAAEADRFVPVVADLTRGAVAGWPDTVDVMDRAVGLTSAVTARFVLGADDPAVSALVGQELALSGSRLRRRRLLAAQNATYRALAERVRRHDGRGLAARLHGMDERAVVLSLRSMLLAGHRVPAAALAWVLHELAEHPEVQERAHTEATSGLPELPLCRAVVRETLRLHPPVWLLRRDLAEPAHGLPRGATVLFCGHVNQRDPVVFPRPDRFAPQRWLRPGPRPAPGSYFPFGLGPRVCPAAGLAITELATVVATVLATHRLRPDRSPGPCAGVLDAPERLRLHVSGR